MKKFALFAISLVVFYGCVKEEFADNALKGERVTVTFNVNYPGTSPDSKISFDPSDSSLNWTGNETMRLIFGGASDNKNNPVIASVAPGVFKGEITIPDGFTLDSLRGFVVPGGNDSYYKKSPRISMYVPEEQIQEKSGELNWDYVPFFYDLSGGGIKKLDDGSYGFDSAITLKCASSMIRFNVYGAHPQQQADEVLKSVRIRAVTSSPDITKSNISGWTEHNLGSSNTAASNFGHSRLRVNLEEAVTIADKSRENGIKVCAGMVLAGKRLISEVRVETDKAVYIKTFSTPKALSKTYYKTFVINDVALDLSTFEKRIDKSSKEWKINEIIRISGIPSLQVTYTKGDDLKESYIAVNDDFYAKYNVSQETRPLTTETIYQVASISKPPLAYIALKLREEGKLDFEKPLYKYWGVYSDTDSITDEEEDAANGLLALFKNDASKEKAKQITAMMVMHHKTGLDNSTYSNIDYTATPGAKYNYSGPAINILDKTIGKILGKTLTEYGREYIFDKIGMTHSSYTYEDEYDTIGAKGYKSDGSEWQRANLKGPNAAYSMRSTADEYSKFLRWMLDGCDLNEESQKMYLENYFSMNYKWEEWHNLIWRTEVNKTIGDVVRHTGSNGFSFRGWVGLFPDQDATLCMFANSPSPNGYDHFNAVLKLFMGTSLASRDGNKQIPGF